MRRLLASRRRIVICGAVVLIVAAVLGGWWGASRNSDHDSAASVQGAANSHSLGTHPGQRAVRPTSSAVAPSRSATPVQAGSNHVDIPKLTLVATIKGAGAPGSISAGARPTRLVPGQWWQASSVLPVVDQQPGWVLVRLAQRPNGSAAWIPAKDVSLAADPYYIVINLGDRRLHLYKNGKEVANFPAGIGVPSAPTPLGQFFVALFARAPSPAYGAFVIVTSAHSNVISDWQESGDAITAIHGPLGSDAAIGTTGAAVSNGCIRLHEPDLTKLRPVPAGTPIEIVE